MEKEKNQITAIKTKRTYSICSYLVRSWKHRDIQQSLKPLIAMITKKRHLRVNGQGVSESHYVYIQHIYITTPHVGVEFKTPGLWCWAEVWATKLSHIAWKIGSVGALEIHVKTWGRNMRDSFKRIIQTLNFNSRNNFKLHCIYILIKTLDTKPLTWYFKADDGRFFRYQSNNYNTFLWITKCRRILHFFGSRNAGANRISK